MPINTRIETLNAMLENIAITNPKYESVWASWELAVIDSAYEKAFGRLRINYNRNDKNTVNLIREELETEKERTDGVYYEAKMNKKEIVTAIENTGKGIEGLAPDLQKTVELVKEIYTQTNEQSIEVNSLSEIANRLSSVADKNKESSKSINDQSLQLMKMANDLNNEIQYFLV